MFSWRRYKIHRAARHVLISTGDVQATIIQPFKDFAKVVVCADRGYFGFKVARDLCAHGVSCSVESECKL